MRCLEPVLFSGILLNIIDDCTVAVEKEDTMNSMDYIKGITFAPFYKRGSLSTQTARKSFDYMIKHTAANFVILAPAGIQKTAHSEEICYTSEDTFSDEELIDMIRYAKSKGIRVGLKPTVNCANGEWAPQLPDEAEAMADSSCEICNKPVQKIIKKYFA